MLRQAIHKGMSTYQSIRTFPIIKGTLDHQEGSRLSADVLIIIGAPDYHNS